MDFAGVQVYFSSKYAEICVKQSIIRILQGLWADKSKKSQKLVRDDFLWYNISLDKIQKEKGEMVNGKRRKASAL